MIVLIGMISTITAFGDAKTVLTPVNWDSREAISLAGAWQIEEGKSPIEIPATFTHEVPVPGLVNLAKPGFANVGDFLSREMIFHRSRHGLAPVDWQTNYWGGKVNQDRDYFWYRKTFRAPAKRAVAILKISKAQFGTAVWLNGKKLGEDSGCFTASYFSLSEAIHWGAENTIDIRVGAHPAVLPDTFPIGQDFEKNKWTPGIYDDVSLIYCDNPVIESIQAAPRISTGEVVVQATLKNYAAVPVTATVVHAVKPWKGGKRAGESVPDSVTLQPGEIKVITQTIKINKVHLWSPEDPFLYVIESSTGGDSLKTRFGMREFRFDAATKRAWLNGKIYYLRGSNITLHRFFEDPLCHDLPWNEVWVRKLLGELPKQMHWNFFRFSIGPVPERWLDICDEAGLLVQNEFPIFSGRPTWFPGYSRSYDTNELTQVYKDWMRDAWNHPSLVVWDACNETLDPSLGATVIPTVRPLDLSGRPWENSWNPAVDTNDPVEYHTYLTYPGHYGKQFFHLSQLETMDGKKGPDELPPNPNPVVLNEYGWLWLNRDGSPTLLTENVYDRLLPTNSTARQRLDLNAYLLAAETEFWRIHRHFAGVCHFVYLTASYPGAYTSDHFADVTKLKLDPAFADYVGEAFKPLGVYINFFQPTLKAGEARDITVMMINDEPQPQTGQLTLTLEAKDGKVILRSQQRFTIAELGTSSCSMSVTVPHAFGDCVLKVVAQADGPKSKKGTVCRRWVTLTD